jgi:hypothetical protein
MPVLVELGVHLMSSEQSLDHFLNLLCWPGYVCACLSKDATVWS